VCVPPGSVANHPQELSIRRIAKRAFRKILIGIKAEHTTVANPLHQLGSRSQAQFHFTFQCIPLFSFPQRICICALPLFFSLCFCYVAVYRPACPPTAFAAFPARPSTCLCCVLLRLRQFFALFANSFVSSFQLLVVIGKGGGLQDEQLVQLVEILRYVVRAAVLDDFNVEHSREKQVLLDFQLFGCTTDVPANDELRTARIARQCWKSSGGGCWNGHGGRHQCAPLPASPLRPGGHVPATGAKDEDQRR